MGPKFVVTLVHGTFDTDAPWMKSNSSLRSRLQAHFGDDIHFEPFNWHPANNSIAARTAAAAKLSLHLAKVKHDYPDAAQYIIAHSHGGNIAMHGANQYMNAHASAHRLWGVACLATPFIHATVRDLGGLTDKNLWWWFYCLFFLCGQVASLWLESSRFLGYWWLVSGILAAVIGGLIGGLFAGLLEGIDLNNVARTLRTSVPAGSNLLIIRGAGDEASLALDTAGLFSRYLSKTFNWLAERQVNPDWRSSKVLAWLHAHGWMTEDQAERWPRSRNVKLPKIVWACWAALFAALLVIVFRNGLSEIGNLRLPGGFWTAAEILFLGTSAIKTTVLDYVLYPAALIILGIISAIGTKSWGTVPTDAASSGKVWRRLMLGLAAGLLVEVTAEALPLGNWSATQLGLDITGAQKARGLRHSVYEDQRVHYELWAWLARSEEMRRLDSLRESGNVHPKNREDDA